MGRRPELKSDEFFVFTPIVIEILSCEHFFTAEKVLPFIGASVRERSLTGSVAPPHSADGDGDGCRRCLCRRPAAQEGEEVTRRPCASACGGVAGPRAGRAGLGQGPLAGACPSLADGLPSAASAVYLLGAVVVVTARARVCCLTSLFATNTGWGRVTRGESPF